MIEMPTRKDFVDLGFVVVAEPGEFLVEFKIYEIDAEAADGTPLLHKLGSPCHPCPADGVDDAEVYAHGSVKWDGCSNWKFDEQERCNLHGCTHEDLLNLGRILGACWEMAGDLCENWCGAHKWSP